jgi:CRISPR-associated protein Cmr2
MRKLFFSLGPVQAFVAESRRTRDLWASSWLLSWLAGHAMIGALEAGQGNRLDLPALTKDQIQQQIQALTAALPNRFVLVADEPTEAAKAAKQRIIDFWHRLAQAVWECFVKPYADRGNKTSQIWDRQVNAFWEVTWVVSDARDSLRSRKLWRTPPLTVEPGDHCTMMPGWQELSGYVTAAGGQEREAKRRFWQTLRSHRQLTELDIDPREQLCSIALIKRLFPKLPREQQGAIFGALMGDRRYPSTADLAVEPWRKRAASHATALNKYESYVTNMWQNVGRKPSQLDGNYFLETALANENATPLPSAIDRKTLLRALRQLYTEVGVQPTPYYAILMADGDRMGAALGAAEAANCLPQFTAALSEFARTLPQKLKGRAECVYTGGDDVLALAAVTSALEAARIIRETFESSLGSVRLPEANNPTISVAVLFTHYRLPFSTQLAAARSLLEDVAKGRSGRNSLALRLHKHSAPTAEFAAQWSWWDASHGDGGNRLESLTTGFSTQGETVISRSYLYKIEELLRALGDVAPARSVGASVALDPAFFRTLRNLLVAESLVGRAPHPGGDGAQEVRRQVSLLWELCTTSSAVVGQDHTEGKFAIDLLRLAEFLAQEGVEPA